MQSAQSNKALNALRWVGFLPVAFLAAWLTWIIINILGNFSFMWIGISPDDAVLLKDWWAVIGSLFFAAGVAVVVWQVYVEGAKFS